MPSVCDNANCNFLPLIRQDIQVDINELDDKVGRDSYCWFLGDLMSNAPVRDVVVEVSIGDQKFSSTTSLEAALPGQLNPFEIGSEFLFHCPTDYQVQVISWEVDLERIYRNTNIVSVSSSLVPFSGMNVTAEIRNDEASPLLDIQGVIWSMDMSYSPIVKSVAASLAPGEAATFTTLIYGTGPSSIIHVSAQGILQP
jgi:hypothetical protein